MGPRKFTKHAATHTGFGAVRTADDIAQRRGQQSRLNRAEQDDRALLARSELLPALAAPGNHDGSTITPNENMEHSFRTTTNAGSGSSPGPVDARDGSPGIGFVHFVPTQGPV